MTITLPEEMRDELEARAKATGFSSAEAYVTHLVLWSEPDAIDEAGFELPPPPAGAEYVVNSREELEQKLLESLNDDRPPIRVTPQYWAEHRERVSELVAARRAKS